MTARPPAAGSELVLEVGEVAHGGHCVARHEGRVVFVRHALPGERVRARVTGTGSGGRFLRADAVEVLVASPARVTPPCPWSGPGRCGGCDWQHASLPEQRRLKTTVLVEALTRLGGLSRIGDLAVADAVSVEAVSVEAAPGDTDGLGWRTRVAYSVGPDGMLGLRRHRSHLVEPVSECRIAHADVLASGVTHRPWPGYRTVQVVVSGTAGHLVVLTPAPPAGDTRAGRAALEQLPDGVAVAGVRGRSWVTESAAGRQWRVDGAGFWQVHPGAADALVDAVRELLAPRPGEHLLDLYSGVGLFAGSMAPGLGEAGRVDAVEGSVQAVRDARRNLHDLPTVRLHQGDVAGWLARRPYDAVDLVVLDPPRSGAGGPVMRDLLALRPRAVAYVACDPAALARDLRTATGLGWQVAAVRAYDLFPMTHHLETVALLLPPG